MTRLWRSLYEWIPGRMTAELRSALNDETLMTKYGYGNGLRGCRGSLPSELLVPVMSAILPLESVEPLNRHFPYSHFRRPRTRSAVTSPSSLPNQAMTLDHRQEYPPPELGAVMIAAPERGAFEVAQLTEPATGQLSLPARSAATP